MRSSITLVEPSFLQAKRVSDYNRKFDKEDVTKSH